MLASMGAMAALFAGFFVLSLLRGYGLQALAYSGASFVLMVGLALGQWRAIRRRRRS